MPITNLDISLFYLDNESGIWTFTDLSGGHGFIEVEHLDADPFYYAEGGIRICKERIYCFLETANSGDINSYVSFLLQSLVELWQGEPTTALDAAKKPKLEYPGRSNILAGVVHLDASVILLSRHNNVILLEYLDSNGEATETRGSPFFKAVAIDPAAWQKAALMALEEYFSVARERLQDANQPAPDSGAECLANLLANWELIRHWYVGNG